MALPVSLPVSLAGGLLALRSGDVSFAVDPRAGGRITSFRHGDREVLLGRAVHPANWGSTLWTSPQTDWGWPPPAAFDDLPFEANVEGPAIVLRGPVEATLGLRLHKRFFVDEAAGGAIAIEYGIENLRDAPKAFAHWEVSRVPARGLTFFPTGASAGGSLEVHRIGAGTWYRHDPTVLSDAGAKSFADGTGGVIAHANAGLLFVKTFADSPPEAQAPGEGEVEIYGNNLYVEVEVQGPYAKIEPGRIAWWSVRWHLRELPAGLAVTPGNDELLAFASRVP